ncbi:YbdK family carboxylate-amine ligase [Nitrosovibrio sp. Nv17]|jgi:carboxylate-amine ligase|uniref:YbdK family carboxylate-amine ligase n=1 Tax=Nitrosovibrio sp. Nv17 TaxID=1855339 RepID=UPI000909169C|nr:YbdK family carboxylate-amine ligase [Nitrosovibrio sp. Nv17]SFW16422.1 carboxylate-amine ligase [Nitrosovibrio sp. Nv17]
MSLTPFAPSRPLSIGVELELQLLGCNDYNLVSSAPDMLRRIAKFPHPGEVKPEMTRSMIEINTSVQHEYSALVRELRALRDVVSDAGRFLNVAVSGGGTHPFQHWSEQKIYDAPRFNYLSELYGYLAKQFTIFGQHVHVGCTGPDEALHLMHMLSRYIPHFIALSASSPFVQGHDTGFASARLNSVFSFPLSGRAPFLLRWSDFEQFFGKMTGTGVVESMKDFYWDIRPKPEFGTIEIRVCDTPLTIEVAAAIACYIQAMARYIMVELCIAPEEDDYLVYTFNRFQACRFGLDGIFIDPRTHERRSIRDDIAGMLGRIAGHAAELGSTEAMERIREMLVAGNGAHWLRQAYAREHNLGDVMQLQADLWMGS